MCVACQHVLVFEHGGWDGFPFCIEDLCDRLGCCAEELGVVELMRRGTGCSGTHVPDIPFRRG